VSSDSELTDIIESEVIEAVIASKITKQVLVQVVLSGCDRLSMSRREEVMATNTEYCDKDNS